MCVLHPRGFNTALTFAKAGYVVYAGMRDLKKKSSLIEEAEKLNVKNNIRILQIDLLSTQSIENAFKEIHNNNHVVDVLVNNAGIGIVGALEVLSEEDILRGYQTNVFGPIKCIQQVLPEMRERKNGMIISVSSVLGVFSLPVYSLYCSSKAAFESFAQSLAQETKAYGIKSIVIQPSGTATDFLNNLTVGTRQIHPNPYLETQDATIKYFKSFDSSTLTTSQGIADLILRAAEDENPQFRYQVSAEHEALVGSIIKDPKGLNLPNFSH